MKRLMQYQIRIFFVAWLIFLYYRAHAPFDFLVLNTFLGYIPIELSFHINQQSPKHQWLFWPLTLVWLLFYPNAPYLLTDLFHLSLLNPYGVNGLLRMQPYMWFYFSMMIVSALACSLLGLWSLKHVSTVITNRFAKGNRWIYAALVVGLSVLSAIGIFIGRFLRLHTIYLLLAPSSFIRPLLQMWTPEMFFFVGALTVVQLVAYWLLFVAIPAGSEALSTDKLDHD